MRFKKILKQLIPLVLALFTLTSGSLAAFADVNANGGGGDNIYDTTDYDNMYNPIPGTDVAYHGARITFVDGTTGNRISGIPTLEYTNYPEQANQTSYWWGSMCKSDYRAGVSLALKADSYTWHKFSEPMPYLIAQASVSPEVRIKEIKDYFGKSGTLEDIIADLNKDYGLTLTLNEIIANGYKVLIEPVAYFKYGGYWYAATPTEASLMAKKAGVDILSNLRPLTSWNLPRSVWLDEPDCGYAVGADVSYKQISAGKFYYTSDDIIDTLGLCILRFPTTPTVPIHYYIYTYEVEVDPDNPTQPDSELWKKIKDENIQPK